MDIYTLTELVRARLPASERDSPDLDDRVALVADRALYALAARKVAPDPRLRRLLLTDPAATTLALDADGKGDLSALVTSQRILVERLGLGSLRREGDSFDLRMLEEADHGALPNALDALFGKFWLDGPAAIATRGADGQPLADATLKLAVVFWPTLEQCPDPLGEVLAECCVELLGEEREEKKGE